ncbi:MAG: Bacterial membrane flanked domain protein [Syntrophorhabdaceae bacterium PtaU1.Bin034]|nr:MAG: Bacterial membrane flanked domain protein [Syntrophorhabdaceae bacterium PtaU1.Bin034]
MIVKEIVHNIQETTVNGNDLQEIPRHGVLASPLGVLGIFSVGVILLKLFPEAFMRTKLQPGETVALVVRKHWVVLLKPALFLTAVCLYIPVHHVKILGFESLLNYLLPYAVALSGGFFLYCCLDRRVNIWAVTSSRLIDEWGVITHRSKENPLDKINDIVVEQTILGRIFGYGSISVQTAATAGETIIESVERPEELKQTINTQKAMRAERSNGGDFFGGDPQGQTKPPRMVLLHESVRPPFSLRCPHCGGEIAIDYVGRASTDHGEDGVKESMGRQCQKEHGIPLAACPEHNCEAERPTVEEAAPSPLNPATADPFSWKKHSR